MSTLILSHNTPYNITAAATSHGFDVIIMPAMPDMAPPVCSHPDMLLYCGFGRVFVRSSHMNDCEFRSAIQKLLSLHTDLTLTVTADPPSRLYPFDVCFNCAVIGGALVGAVNTMSASVKRAATNALLPIINSPQGYVKCSSLLLHGDSIASTRAVITSDPSIARIAAERSVRVVKLDPGGVTLPGYDTGFIGGASFYYDNAIYFLGSIDLHPNCDKIKEAARSLNIDIFPLSDCPLFDAGCLLID